MIIHLFPQEKFTVPFIKFINNNFNCDEHLFIVHGKNVNYKKYEVKQYNNIIYINKENRSNIIKFIKYINKADKIIIHSLFIPKWLKYYLVIKHSLLKKSEWVIWGGDLYSYRLECKNLKSKISSYIKKEIIKNLKVIITLSRNDYLLAKQWYEAKGVHKQAVYINPISLDYLESIKFNKMKDDNTINIQIGNSADQSNLHFEVIDILEKFKEENIKIYVPLSYGDSKYAMKVKEYGENIFKEKFIAMLDFLDKDKYGDFLGKIDIAIFNNNRQQALGNIRALAYLGSKIYMRDDTTMWNDFILDGYKINRIDNLRNENFKDFVSINDSTININSNLAEYTFNEKLIAEKWEDIFNN